MRRSKLSLISVFGLGIIILAITIGLFFESGADTLLMETKQVRAKVIKIEEYHDITTKDGNISTTHTYFVVTDIGVMKITPEGLNASKCYGRLEEDREYTLTIRGLDCPQANQFPYILDAE